MSAALEADRRDARPPGRPGGFLAPALLTCACLWIYGLTSYWGIRSPDAEVVFRTARALVEDGTFALDGARVRWRGFGTAPGIDGRAYSVFGPGQAVATAPLLALASRPDEDGEVAPSPMVTGTSHYVNGGLSAFIAGTPPQQPAEHRLRARVAALNVVVGALTALVFYHLSLRLSGSRPAALLAGWLFAFGTLAWPYSGTFFSEPLAMLFVVLSLIPLVPDHGAAASRRLLAGLLLGTAVTVHLSAILFAPFLGLYFVAVDLRHRRFSGSLAWAGGLATLLVLLGWHNAVRFGSPFETGRTAGNWVYAQWVPPWSGLVGLLASWGKGLVWYCPLIVLGVLVWRKLHGALPGLGPLMLAAAAARVLFLACRSDWHGGFALGPRYLVMAVPVLLLPLAPALHDQLVRRRLRTFVATAAFSMACASQQLYFSMGEIFSYLHLQKARGLRFGVDVFEADAIYFRWTYSPLTHLFAGRAGPLALQGREGSLTALWAVGAAVLCAGMAALFVWAWRATRPAAR